MDPTWAVGSPRSEPVALGVTGPHTGHRELSEALLRPVSTADSGLASARVQTTVGKRFSRSHSGALIGRAGLPGCFERGAVGAAGLPNPNAMPWG